MNSEYTTTDHALSQCIYKILKENNATPLLQDNTVILNGKTILEFINEINRHIAGFAPKGSAVGICMPTSAIQGLAILAIIASERVPVIIAPEDLKDVHIFEMLHQNMYAIIINDINKLTNYKIKVPCIQISINEIISHKPTDAIVKDKILPRAGTGVILFTSGSTGHPKGVEIPIHGVEYTVNTLIQWFHLSSSTIATINLPLSHTMTLNTQFLPTFFAGGRSIFFNSERMLGRMYRSIIDSKGTFITLISDLLSLLHDEKQKFNLPAAEQVKDLQLAGSKIKSQHIKTAKYLFPNACIHKGYGLTEAIRISMINSNEPGFEKDTAGRALPGQEVVIKNSNGIILPPSKIGFIHVRGPNVMCGYWATAFSDNKENFFNTGDIGYITKEEGYLVIEGRTDGIFKVAGKRVSAKEIENAALLADDVKNAICLPIPDPIKGEKPLLFILTSSHNGKLLPGKWYDNLEEALINNLASYKIPQSIVILDKFPLTKTNKIKRKFLLERWEELNETSEPKITRKGLKLWLANN